jgi:hypothetical protein
MQAGAGDNSYLAECILETQPLHQPGLAPPAPDKGGSFCQPQLQAQTYDFPPHFSHSRLLSALLKADVLGTDISCRLSSAMAHHCRSRFSEV